MSKKKFDWCLKMTIFSSQYLNYFFRGCFKTLKLGLLSESLKLWKRMSFGHDFDKD